MQSVAQELSSIDWQAALGDMVQVKDLVAVFMRIMYAALHRVFPPSRRRTRKPQLLRHTQFIIGSDACGRKCEICSI